MLNAGVHPIVPEISSVGRLISGPWPEWPVAIGEGQASTTVISFQAAKRWAGQDHGPHR
jgi:histidine ammonia-lyase